MSGPTCCMFCNEPIAESMGSVLARDLMMLSAGAIKPTDVRVLCGKCALQQSEFDYVDIPLTAEESRVLAEQMGD